MKHGWVLTDTALYIIIGLLFFVIMAFFLRERLAGWIHDITAIIHFRG